MTLIAVPVVVVAIVACYYDVRTRRIPNGVTFGSAVIALTFHVLTAGWGGMSTATGGWLVGAAMFFPFFALGGMGAGDVKLMAALGAWFGSSETFWLVIYTWALGGVMGLALALATGYLRPAVMNTVELVRFWVIVGLRPHPEFTLERASGPRLAYALPMLAGVIVKLWL